MSYNDLIPTNMGKMTSKIKHALAQTSPSLKSVAKMLLQSRCTRPWPRRDASRGDAIVVMGNGPSLAQTIAEHGETLASMPTMAVNFAAIAPEFTRLRPGYYIMVDPLFFAPSDQPNMVRLRRALADVDWDMTLIVPRGKAAKLDPTITANPHIHPVSINAVGLEGWQWLTHWAYSHRLGMPRPRNVLIPAIMTAAWLGYDTIYVAGADHSWMRTIAVDDHNNVISVQPHFYKDDASEQKRVDTTYRGYRLHDIVHSFYVAFRSYHLLQAWARRRHIDIFNVTPGSYIDAFDRKNLDRKDGDNENNA